MTVQVVEKRGSRVVSVKHVGSANSDADLAVLLERAEQLLHPEQEMLDLGDLARSASMEAVADWRTSDPGLDREVVESRRLVGRPRSSAGPSGVVVGQPAQILWKVLTDSYRHLGFDVLGDDVFMKIVLARIVEPTSKIDALRVLDRLGVDRPASEKTVYRMLERVNARKYREQLAQACFTHASREGPLTLVMYDATTLHFQVEVDESSPAIEFEPRRVGHSKEHRVDPQIQVGLLVDPGGFPLDVCMFPGNKGETLTLVPIVKRFLRAHPGIEDLVVVADAGLLSADNLYALEAEKLTEGHHLRFIVGSRNAKTPYDLADYFAAHGNHAEDGQVIETTRIMGQGSKARERRVVYQYRFARAKREERTLDLQVTRARQVAGGQRAMKKDRFVRLTGDKPVVNETMIDRAREALGYKGYVTNIPETVMTGEEVIAAYHNLFQVERSFRMTKGDLAARPIYLRDEDRIQAHLTTVMATLAVARDLQNRAGLSIRRILHALEPLRSSRIRFGDDIIEFPPQISTEQQDLLDTLRLS